jgi:3D (Asp-Asp-Asp) domain-containing protein
MHANSTMKLLASLAFACWGLAVASPPSKVSPMLGEATTELYTVTAYCACKKCCGRWSGGPTASGKMPVVGVTCAGPRSIPFGTRVRIEGVGVRVVQDRLAKRFDNRFDVFFGSDEQAHERALRFGKRQLKVEVLR